MEDSLSKGRSGSGGIVSQDWKFDGFAINTLHGLMKTLRYALRSFAAGRESFGAL